MKRMRMELMKIEHSQKKQVTQEKIEFQKEYGITEKLKIKWKNNEMYGNEKY